MTKVATAELLVCQNLFVLFTRNKIASVPFALIRFDLSFILKKYIQVGFEKDENC